MSTHSHSDRLTLGWRDTYRLLLPYAKRNLTDQLKSIWFIVAYLILFQLLVLHLPLVYSAMIAVGIGVVALGLMFFMEGLRVGLMPLGEAIGVVLPRSGNMLLILGFAFLLGLGATFAEPAIAVLKTAGAGVQPEAAPLLYSLLNDFSGELVSSVGIGVGLAVLLGVLRFFYGWSLKLLAIPAVSLLLGLSMFFSQTPLLNDILGLAWDCGAVTTGPVTVPLVLALGIGVCRIVNSGSDHNAGFGIVTLASLFPILAVLLLALFHYNAEDYYGGKNYQGDLVSSIDSGSVEETTASGAEQLLRRPPEMVSEAEYQRYLQTGELPDQYEISFGNSTSELVDGALVLQNPEVRIVKKSERSFHAFSDENWDSELSLAEQAKVAVMDAIRAIIPLCLFLFFVQRYLLKQTLHRVEELRVGILFAVVGMSLFGLGIALGLMPLGGQLGGNVPVSFAEITPWGMKYAEGPIFESEHAGKLLAILFAFFLGYGATLAEPALNALGDTVEKITVGAFRKPLLMQCVAIGVGFGIAAGICKIAYNLPLIWMLVPPYAVVLVLTWFSKEDFVNFGWDSAGVTTGPITVPLVLAMGLGIGGNIPGVSDGFGILALASVGPIMTVLAVGLFTSKNDELSIEESEEEPVAEAVVS
ncbi:MAG: DUF1538 domain-containing protein [Pseudomonadales bacterium]